MHTGYEVIDRLKSLNAISTIDAEEIKEEKGAYRMSTKLLSAIMRRSNRCYNNFQEVLRETGQQHVVEMLSCGKHYYRIYDISLCTLFTEVHSDQLKC